MTDDTKSPDLTRTSPKSLSNPRSPGKSRLTLPNPIRSSLLKAENADLRDKFLRLAAEMDNLRRRTERDVKDAKAYSLAGFARDMLAVSDNLRRALEAIPDELKTNGEAGLNGLIEGVEMTERSMLSTLERHGVKKIDAEGQKFDPNFHQAMFEIPNPAVPNNTVLQVVQAGFTIGDRVLRPAMVGVAKGGPKAEVAASAEPGTSSLNEKTRKASVLTS